MGELGWPYYILPILTKSRLTKETKQNMAIGPDIRAALYFAFYSITYTKQTLLSLISAKC